METLRGVWYDPRHGACVRVITHLRDDVWQLAGAYGEDEAGAPGTPWRAHVQVRDTRFLIVDFYDKRTAHDRIMHALWCPDVREIHWEDGHVWKKLYSEGDAAA